MLSGQVRARAQDVLIALARILMKWGITPNTLTVVGFVMMCLAGLVIASGNEASAGLLVVFAGALDALDGTLARVMGRVSKFGAMLDSTLDRWAEAALFLGIVFRAEQRYDNLAVLLAVLALVGSLLVSYARARGEGLGASIKEGWFTRFERIVVLIAGLLLTVILGPVALTAALGLIAFFANLTAVQRLLAARRVLE